MKIKKAIIPAAGLGTRFLPAAKRSRRRCLRMAKKEAVYGYYFKGRRYDCGAKLGFL